MVHGAWSIASTSWSDWCIWATVHGVLAPKIFLSFSVENTDMYDPWCVDFTHQPKSVLFQWRRLSAWSPCISNNSQTLVQTIHRTWGPPTVDPLHQDVGLAGALNLLLLQIKNFASMTKSSSRSYYLDCNAANEEVCLIASSMCQWSKVHMVHTLLKFYEKTIHRYS